MKKNTTIYWFVGMAIVLVALFAYPRLQSGNSGGIGSGVPCLVPNVPLTQHIHPVLTIYVDGKNEEIPAGVGLKECERSIHTHDDDAARGVIHVESQDRREYTLGDFFSVWGKTIEREGFSVKAEAGGKALADPANLTLEDGQQIVLKYAKVAQ